METYFSFPIPLFCIGVIIANHTHFETFSIIPSRYPSYTSNESHIFGFFNPLVDLFKVVCGFEEPKVLSFTYPLYYIFMDSLGFSKIDEGFFFENYEKEVIKKSKIVVFTVAKREVNCLERLVESTVSILPSNMCYLGTEGR